MSGFGLAQEPSLAEAARKAREKKLENPTKQVRVITNADLQTLKSNVSVGRPAAKSSSPAQKTGQEAPGAKPDAETAASTEDRLATDEMEQLQQDLDSARTNLQIAVNEGLVLQLRLNNLRNAFMSRSDGSTQERVQAMIAQTFQQFQENTKSQEQIREEIRTLQSKALSMGLSKAEVERMTGRLPEASAQLLAPEANF
jgi:hypothetical protein